MKVWVLSLENFEGENGIELYSTYEKANTALENYISEYKEADEFTRTNDGASWFDPAYNSHSTYLMVYEEEIY